MGGWRGVAGARNGGVCERVVAVLRVEEEEEEKPTRRSSVVHFSQWHTPAAGREIGEWEKKVTLRAN